MLDHVVFMLYMEYSDRGMKQTNWGIDLLLKSLHGLFNETPTRREDYMKITESEVFPQQFCGHRWLEERK